MSDTASFGLKLTAEPSGAKSRRAGTGPFVADTLLSLVLLVSVTGIAMQAFAWNELTSSVWAVFLVGGLALTAVKAVLYMRPGRQAVLSALTVSVLVLGGAYLTAAPGFAMLADQCASTLSIKTGRIVLGFDSAAASERECLTALAASCAVLGVFIALSRRIIRQMALAFALLGWLLVVFHFVKTDARIILLSLSSLALQALAVFWHNTFDDGRALALGMMKAALLTASVLCVPLFFGWFANREPSREIIAQAVHHLRYGGQTQAMPEGNLRSLGALVQDDAPMLRVRMTKAQPVYLRSYVGETYAGSQWKPLEPEARSGYADLFFWLHKNGFYGQTQLSAVAALLAQEQESVLVSVETLGACRQYACLPYELAGADVLDAGQIGDAASPLAGLWGSGRYAFALLPGQVKNAYALLDTLETVQDNPELQPYRKQEAAYRAFVYDNYTAVSEDHRGMLEALLKGEPSGLSSFEVKQNILDFLHRQVGYNPVATVPDDPADFLSDFLLRSQSGYSVHYATAAAILLRYWGIPARYVEGYLVTPDETEGIDGAYEATLTNQSAHAWAEYYEDGIGWIPFETCPAYIGVMEEPEWLWFTPQENAEWETERAKEEGASLGSEEKPGPETQKERKPDTNAQPEIGLDIRPVGGGGSDPDGQAAFTIFWRWILLALLVMLLAGLLFVFLRRQRALKRRKKRFASADIPYAVGALFAYGMQILWQSDLEKRNLPLAHSREAINRWFADGFDVEPYFRLNQEALFSRHSLSEAHRDHMRSFADGARKRFAETASLVKRLRAKWMYCLY